jgi:general nucleoside transport system ATP-binding protein
MSDCISLQHITKIFPPAVVALDDVSVTFRRGEIHAVVGENGAGKSTLMKVLYGQEQATRGEIQLEGQPVHLRDAGAAIARGIGMVHQEIVLIPAYTVWENVVLGAEPVRGPFGQLQVARARQQVQERINAFGLQLDPDAIVDTLSVAARQKVEILKLLYREVAVLILDEPTSVLTPQEIPPLFDELRRLRASGKTILFISHHLEEVLTLCDRVTVLRKGRWVDTVPAAGLTKARLAQMMVGRELAPPTCRAGAPGRAVVAQLEGLAYQEARGRQRLHPVTLAVHAGEIVGVAGVEGNGQLELTHVLMGLLPATAGQFTINGRALTGASILERRQHMAFVSPDRRRMGASVSASILENAVMTHHRLTPALTRWGGRLLDLARMRQFVETVRQTYAVTMGEPEAPFQSLSGGNQQKVILGRELLLDRVFLLLDQPTRGLDVGSMEYLHAQILREREEGRAILLISADLEELFHLADRIAVLYRGRLVGVWPAEAVTREAVGYAMLEGAGPA